MPELKWVHNFSFHLPLTWFYLTHIPIIENLKALKALFYVSANLFTSDLNNVIDFNRWLYIEFLFRSEVLRSSMTIHFFYLIRGNRYRESIFFRWWGFIMYGCSWLNWRENFHDNNCWNLFFGNIEICMNLASPNCPKTWIFL